MRTRSGREIGLGHWWTEHGTLAVEATASGTSVGTLSVAMPTDGSLPYVDMVQVKPGWQHDGVATLLCWRAAVILAEKGLNMGMPDLQSPAGKGLFKALRGFSSRQGGQLVFDLQRLSPALRNPPFQG